MKDLYSTIHEHCAALIDAISPDESTHATLNCVVTTGNVSYTIDGKREKAGVYECTIGAHTSADVEYTDLISERITGSDNIAVDDAPSNEEINLATARLIREALSDPDTLENIKDRTISTKALINSILSTLEPEGITLPVDMAVKTLQMSQRKTANQ